MAVQFPMQALTHPTGHRHRQQIPGLGFGVSNGPSLNPGSFPSATDGGDNYNTGLVANISITHQFAQRNDERWNAVQTSGMEQMLFRNGSTTRTAANVEADGYLVSVYALNYFLSTEKGRADYLHDWDFSKFNSDWRFVGVQKSKEGPDLMVMNNDTRVMTVTVGGRAHIPDITRAQCNVKEKQHDSQVLSISKHQTVNDNDVLWLVPRKYYKDGLLYTKITPYATTTQMPPPLELCSGYVTIGGKRHFWSSAPIRVGLVNIVHGDRAANNARISAARRVIEGNDGNSDQRWKDLQSLGRIDIMVGF